ncbi:hypothetical protein [Evansella clarkii]|nr:hypothetical protein [Evansella clarkii]
MSKVESEKVCVFNLAEESKLDTKTHHWKQIVEIQCLDDILITN